MPKVALIGAAFSTPPEIHPGTEIWTVGRLAGVFPHVDRAYELHSKQVYSPYLKTIQTAIKNGAKMYMHEPIEGALALPEKFLRESTGGFFRGTPSYMVAHAVLDLYDEIELHGLNLSGDDYREQRPSLLYHLGIAFARGIEIRDFSHLIDWEAAYGLNG